MAAEGIDPYGRLDEIKFLSRVWDLESMPSTDPRCNNALQDIGQHTVANYDWEDGWVYGDERFGLEDGEDEIFLRFLCETIHPMVRAQVADAERICRLYNRVLTNDGYELREQARISGKPVFGAAYVRGGMEATMNARGLRHLILLDLQEAEKENPSYLTDDSSLPSVLSTVSLDEIRRQMENLDELGYIELVKTFGGHSGRILPAGRLYLEGVSDEHPRAQAAQVRPTTGRDYGAPSSSNVDPVALRVFLCHASEDKPRVRELYHAIAGWGYRPWLDDRNLLPGQEWKPEIRKAIRDSHVVLVCLSKRATTKSGFVQAEIISALDVADEQPEGTIFIVPARLDDCIVPARLQRWQWVDYFEHQGENRLKEALRARSATLRSGE